MNPTRCRIVIGPDDTRAYVPFDAKEIVKLLPNRRWNKILRCWILPNGDADYLHRLLAADGRIVAVIRLEIPAPLHAPPSTPIVPGRGLAAARAAAAVASQARRVSASQTESAA